MIIGQPCAGNGKNRWGDLAAGKTGLIFTSNGHGKTFDEVLIALLTYICALSMCIEKKREKKKKIECNKTGCVDDNLSADFD